MLDVDPKDLLEVAAAHDQQPVQALGTDSAHPALRVGVCLGRPDWGHQDFGVLRPEHVVEAAGELRVVVAEQEADLSSSLPHRQQQVAGLLGDPAAVGVGGHPLWVPDIRVTSCDLRILMDQPTDSISS